MDLLKQRIIQEGSIISDRVLKLDTILNHQVDPVLVMEMGKEFAKRFGKEKITKVVTIESSGISIAFATALVLNVPLVFARRKKTLTTDQDVYSVRVPSFTKGIVTDLVIAKQFLQESDRVLVIDDIIANGAAARGIVHIIEESEAELVGFGVAVEKSFQEGAENIRQMGIRLESLAKVVSLENGQVTLES